jgi:tRNA uridine 5-carboxymethylaminomethyl modification enzyme
MVDCLDRTMFPTQEGNERFATLGLEGVTKPVSLLQVLCRPDVRFHHVAPLAGEGITAFGGEGITTTDGTADRIESVVKYMGYLDRQERDIQLVRELEARAIPADFSYEAIGGLSTEARQKLIRKRPETIAQASRISGVRASDLSILAVHLERHRRSIAPHSPVAPHDDTESR